MISGWYASCLSRGLGAAVSPAPFRGPGRSQAGNRVQLQGSSVSSLMRPAGECASRATSPPDAASWGGCWPSCTPDRSLTATGNPERSCCTSMPELDYAALALLLEALTDRKVRRRLVGRLRPHVVGWSYPRRRIAQRPRAGVLIGWHHCQHPVPAVTGKVGDPLPGSLTCQCRH